MGNQIDRYWSIICYHYMIVVKSDHYIIVVKSDLSMAVMMCR